MVRVYKPKPGVSYRDYSQLSLERAVEDVLSGKSKIAEAALEYKIPRMTLSDHVSRRHPKKCGQQTAFCTLEIMILFDIFVLSQNVICVCGFFVLKPKTFCFHKISIKNSIKQF